MRYGSVCSGIEAASVAWHPLGWKAAWLAEIEPFPSAVLAHRFPDIANHGDMTKLAGKVLAGKIEAPDILVGGTPCQAFSVAGMRAGLADPRGELTIRFVELADAIDHVRVARGSSECVICWENVPGVLSDKGNAFGCFLAALVGESDALVPSGDRWTDAGCVYGPNRSAAWRILDAQYFGLAQRRRRVFVVASARAGFDPAAVLFESEGVRRDFAPSREAREEITGTISSRTSGGGGLGTDFECAGGLQPARNWPAEVASTLDARFGKNHGQENQHVNAGCPLFVPVLSVHGTQGPDVRHDQAHTLGRNSGQENAAFPINTQLGLRGAETSNSSREGIGLGGEGDPAFTLQAAHHHAIATSMQVRRLTPRECERLQGFPDDWTQIEWRGKPASDCPDGPRYKAIGNSKAVPVVRWIGKRIETEINRTART